MTKTEILQEIKAQHQEKDWTRFAVNNYTVNNFKDLDRLLDQIKTLEDKDERDEIEEELRKIINDSQNNSIVGLYLIGVLRIEEQESYILRLLNIFADKLKWNLIKYICDKVSSVEENKNVLKYYAKALEGENAPQSELFKAYERIVKIDHEDPEFTLKMASILENDPSKKEECIFYYKKTMFRFLSKKEFSRFKDIWTKLLVIDPDDNELYAFTLNKVLSALDVKNEVERAKVLSAYKVMLDKSLEKKDYDYVITLLKKMLELDSKEKTYRTKLIESYKIRYADHSQLKNALNKSNIEQPLREVFQSIKIFEAYVKFDIDSFVYHNSWGLGKVKAITDEGLEVYFSAEKKKKPIKFEMANSSLIALKPMHIWVLKEVVNRKKLIQKIKNDPKWTLKIIIDSFPEQTDIKKIKEELVPDLLKPTEWTPWSQKAKTVLRTDSSFSVLSENSSIYTYKEQDLSIDKKYIDQFKAEKDFNKKVKVYKDFIKHIKEEQKELVTSQGFQNEVLSYFISYANQIDNNYGYTEQSFISLLLISELKRDFPELEISLNADMKLFLESNKARLFELFELRDDSEHKKAFLREVQASYDDWVNFYLESLIVFQNKDLVTTLVETNHTAELIDLMNQTLNLYTQRKSFFVWFYKNFKDETWFVESDIERQQVISRMLSLLDETSIAIENKRNISLNKKVNSQITTILFKNGGEIEKFVEEATDEDCQKLYSLAREIKFLNSDDLNKIQDAIKSKGTKIKVIKKKELTQDEIEQGFFASQKSFLEKQKLLNLLKDVELPENALEIDKARQHGDLKENAEYKAAREKQRQLQNTVTRLQKEFNEVKVIDLKDIPKGIVYFGTTIKITDLDSKKQETYHIMGPWESDGGHSVISYQAPLGRALLNRKTKEEFEFAIDKRVYKYRIDEIEISELMK